jgi:hypothetical protein
MRSHLFVAVVVEVDLEVEFPTTAHLLFASPPGCASTHQGRRREGVRSRPVVVVVVVVVEVEVVVVSKVEAEVES